MDLVFSHHDEAGQDLPQTVEGGKATDLTQRNCLRKRLLTCIGAHDFFSPEMWRAALTELVATATLIFTLTSSIISCLDSHEPNPKLIVPVTVFIIAFLFFVVTVPLSGGHISPVFTFMAALKGIITFARASIYFLAQCLGSITGFLIIRSVMSPQAAEKYSLGGCTIRGNGTTSSGVSPGTAFMLEFWCTFVVLYLGVTVAFDRRKCRELGLTMVCIVVAGAMAVAMFVSVTVTGRAGYAGVGLNPARCLGPALLLGGPLWEGHWVFWVGPFLACIVYYCFSKNLPKQDMVWADEKYDLVKLAGTCFGNGTSTCPSNEGVEQGAKPQSLRS